MLHSSIRMCSFRQLSGLLGYTWPICSPGELTGSPKQIKEMGTGSAVSQPTAADSCRLPLTAACHTSDLLSACWLWEGQQCKFWLVSGRRKQQSLFRKLLKVVCFKCV